jgi:hypothetical protein
MAPQGDQVGLEVVLVEPKHWSSERLLQLASAEGVQKVSLVSQGPLKMALDVVLQVLLDTVLDRVSEGVLERVLVRVFETVAERLLVKVFQEVLQRSSLSPAEVEKVSRKGVAQLAIRRGPRCC